MFYLPRTACIGRGGDTGALASIRRLWPVARFLVAAVRHSSGGLGLMPASASMGLHLPPARLRLAGTSAHGDQGVCKEESRIRHHLCGVLATQKRVDTPK